MNSLLRFTIAFILGIWVGNYLNFQFKIILPVIVLVLVSLIIFFKNRYLSGTFLMLLAFVLGLLNLKYQDQTQQSNHLVNFTTDSIKFYKAQVISLPESRLKTYKVEVETEATNIENVWKEATGKVILYVDKKAKIPQYGDVLIVIGSPKHTQPPLNPDEFDYAQFLSYRQIFYTQYLRQTDFIFTNQNNGLQYKKWAYSISQWSDNQLKKLMPWPREYAVAKAMVLGIRDEMDIELTNAYAVAGAVHVLSVSGFHIAIFVYILSKLLYYIEKRKYGNYFYLVITLFLMWFYAVLTGLSAPVIRSALMFTIYLLAKPLHRKENTANALFGSALILLCFDPQLIYSVSFQLSYLALGGIIFLQPKLYQSITFENKILDKLWNLTAVAFAAQLATFPLLILYFHQFSTYFWLANPAVVGLSFLLLPLAFATIALSWIPWLSTILGYLTTFVTWLLNVIVLGIEQLPYSRLDGLWFTKVEVVLVYIIIGLLLAMFYFQSKKWLWYAIFLSVGLFGFQTLEHKNAQTQKQIVVHHIQNQTVISLIDGQRAWILADSSFFHQPRGYDFYLANFYTQKDIRRVTQVAWELPESFIKSLPFGKIVVWNNQKIVLIDKPIIQFYIRPDMVIVQNSAFKDAEKVRQVFQNQNVIFDGSNKPWVIEKLIGLPYYFTSKRGAFVSK